MPINCIIIDDEPAAQEILQKYISDCPTLNMVATCNNALEASELLSREDVHLMFLDINMPKLSGMSFYKSLAKPPAVIFTTAYSEFALEGFEVNAVDYLLKPFPFDRFLKAVNKVFETQQTAQPEISQTHVLLKSDKKIHRVNADEIFHLEAVGDYINVHMRRGSLIVHETFKSLMEQLPSEKFVRIHKSHAVAIDRIEYLEGNQIKIRDKYLPIGQSFRADFLERFGKLPKP